MSKALEMIGQVLGGVVIGIIVILFNLYLMAHQTLGRMGILKKTIKGYPYKNEG